LFHGIISAGRDNEVGKAMLKAESQKINTIFVGRLKSSKYFSVRNTVTENKL
jgi:hypothetical protein